MLKEKIFLTLFVILSIVGGTIGNKPKDFRCWMFIFPFILFIMLVIAFRYLNKRRKNPFKWSDFWP